MSFTRTPHGIMAAVPQIEVDGLKLVDLMWTLDDPKPGSSKSHGRVYLALSDVVDDDVHSVLSDGRGGRLVYDLPDHPKSFVKIVKIYLTGS